MTEMFNFLKNSFGGFDLARLSGLWMIASYSGGFLYSLLWLHARVEWSSLGTGYLQVATGAVLFIGGKELAVAKAKATIGGTDASSNGS